MWAAYKNGEAAFEPKVFPPGLEMDDFRWDDEKSFISRLLDDHQTIMLEAQVEGRGRIPVGMATLETSGSMSNDTFKVWPHISWFWWASARNRYEALFKFFLKYDEEYKFLVHVEKGSQAERICTHLKDLGILRRIGVSDRWYEGGPGVLFEGKA